MQFGLRVGGHGGGHGGEPQWGGTGVIWGKGGAASSWSLSIYCPSVIVSIPHLSWNLADCNPGYVETLMKKHFSALGDAPWDMTEKRKAVQVWKADLRDGAASRRGF